MNNQQAKKLKRILWHNHHQRNHDAHKVLVLVKDEQEIDDVRRIVASVSNQRVYDDDDYFVGCSVPRVVYATTDMAEVHECIVEGEYEYSGGAGLGRVVLKEI